MRCLQLSVYHMVSGKYKRFVRDTGVSFFGWYGHEAAFDILVPGGPFRVGYRL